MIRGSAWILVSACADPPLPCTMPPVPSAGFAGNIVLIVIDDIGVDKVGSYGVHDMPAPTPNIDALAATGVKFTSAYSQPFCSPARAAILTGRRAVRTGIGSNVGRHDEEALPEGEITVPEALDQLDGSWATMAVGKWHLSPAELPLAPTSPLDQGFAAFDGTLGNPRERTDGPLAGGYYSWQRDVDGELSISEEYLVTAQADAAIAAVHSLPEPFFLYVALSGAHVPLHLPPVELWDQAEPVDDPGIGDAMIEATDRELGRILAAIGDRATVLLTGDNGTASPLVRPPLRARQAKGTLYPAGIHVPFVIAGPGIAPAESDALVHVTDLFPTVLDLAGLEASDLGVPLDGRTLVPLLDGQDIGRRCVFVDRFAPNGDAQRTFDAVTVLEDGYQLVRNDKGPDELYVRDPFAPVQAEDLLAAGDLTEDAAAALSRMRAILRHDDAR